MLIKDGHFGIFERSKLLNDSFDCHQISAKCIAFLSLSFELEIYFCERFPLKEELRIKIELIQTALVGKVDLLYVSSSQMLIRCRNMW